MQPTIEVLDVSKKYRIGKAPLSLRSLFNFRNHKNQYHWAVKDVNFSLYPGQALGIIGPNGSGKTTILKLLSKVTFPSAGKINMNGRFSALIELGAGFHPELTGRENIFLNGTILGMRKPEIQARFDQIVAFAGIDKFLDTPVKRYSSGMYARLGFSVAAHIDPDILLVDEVLAVGDMAFQKKCYSRMVDLIKKGTTLIFVSHNMRAIQKVCSECMVMYRGNPVFQGPTGDATAEYSNILREAATNDTDPIDENLADGIAQHIMTHGAVINNVEIVRENQQPAYTFEAGETVSARFQVIFHEPVPHPVIACMVLTPDGQIIYDYTTEWAHITTPKFEAQTTRTVAFQLKLNLAPGTYRLGVNIAYQDLSKYYDRIDRALDFVVTSHSGSRGITDLQAEFYLLPTPAKQ